MRAVYYIATDKEWGHVHKHVWEILEQEGYLNEKTDLELDGMPVYRYTDEKGDEFWFVPTERAICLSYEKYLPFMNEHFADFDISGMVTWHEGQAAEPNVLTCHTLGDMDSGYFAPTRPHLMRNVMHGMDRHLKELGLDEYHVATEGTHWSGVFAGEGDPSLLVKYPVSMMDLEVGSDPSSWDNIEACRALTRSLFDIFTDDGRKVHNILYVGGVHFDPNTAEAVFTEWDNDAFGITHILSNQWLVTGEYETEEGFEKAVTCVEAIEGGIEAIFMHDKLKGCYKDLARALGEKYNVPVFKHQKLRQPEGLGL